MSRYFVKNPVIEEKLKSIGRTIKQFLPAGWGFTLFLFDLDTTKGSIFYLSSAERSTMINSLKEFIANVEKEGK